MNKGAHTHLLLNLAAVAVVGLFVWWAEGQPGRLQDPDSEPHRCEHHPGPVLEPDLRLHRHVQPGPRRVHGHRGLCLLHPDPHSGPEGHSCTSWAAPTNGCSMPRPPSLVAVHGGRAGGGAVRLHRRLPPAAPGRRLPGHRHLGLRRDRAGGGHQHEPRSPTARWASRASRTRPTCGGTSAGAW